jgi:hypothetical protein
MQDTLGNFFGATMCSTYVAITGVTATGATTFTATPVGTAAAISFCIKGKAFTKATIAGGATPTTDAVTAAAFPPLAANQGTIVVLGLNAAGTILAAQGSIEGLDSGGNFQVAPQFPSLPDTMCPFAYIVVKDGATGGAWTFGTSNWNATGITATPVSVMMLPARPQTA